MALEDSHRFEEQLKELSEERQLHADLLVEMADDCATTLHEVCKCLCLSANLQAMRLC